jgi:hypothetical protein
MYDQNEEGMTKLEPGGRAFVILHSSFVIFGAAEPHPLPRG